VIQTADPSNLASSGQLAANLVIGNLWNHDVPTLIETIMEPDFAT
jgi:hypothetical protein